MLKDVDTTNGKNKNNNLVNVISSGVGDLKKEIEDMSKEKKVTEKPNKIVGIVKKILKFNKQNQTGVGLKILATSQMLIRLPISLAQLRAGNNSEKSKNEIRQLLYSLNRSKKLTKTIYNNLINAV